MENETSKKELNIPPLVSLSNFKKSGRAPVEMNHLIFQNRDSLVDFGVLVRYGRKWLISESH